MGSFRGKRLKGSKLSRIKPDIDQETKSTFCRESDKITTQVNDLYSTELNQLKTNIKDH
jgi:hypothetical protein